MYFSLRNSSILSYPCSFSKRSSICKEALHSKDSMISLIFCLLSISSFARIIKCTISQGVTRSSSPWSGSRPHLSVRYLNISKFPETAAKCRAVLCFLANSLRLDLEYSTIHLTSSKSPVIAASYMEMLPTSMLCSYSFTALWFLHNKSPQSLHLCHHYFLVHRFRFSLQPMYDQRGCNLYRCPYTHRFQTLQILSGADSRR